MEHGTACRKDNLELAADRAGEAGHQASAFWGRDSLMAVQCHTHVVTHFTEMSLDGPPNIETDGCRRRAMVELLRDVLPQLSQRLTDGTLALGKCREPEVDHYARWAARTAVAKLSDSSADKLRNVIQQQSKAFGVFCVLDAVLVTLHLLALPQWPDTQRLFCETFVLAGLDFFGHCGIALRPSAEEKTGKKFRSFAAIGEDMESLHSTYDKAFFEEAQQKWRALHETWQRLAAADAAPRAAPSTKCELPSCDKAERTDGGFKRCSGCKRVMYCSGEHQLEDWKRHKKECKKEAVA